MAEQLIITSSDKQSVYEEIIPQISSLIRDESDVVANMANIAAVLREAFHFFWVGFYTVRDNQMVLSPFQGPLACTRINFGKGVCGTAWKEQQTIIVPDVDNFPGHIACSSASRSEIVVPIFHGDEVFAVLDIDSDTLNSFDEIDKTYLEKICAMI